MTQNLGTAGAELKLCYWGIRGLAQPIRFLLAMADAPYEEIRIGVTPSGELLSKDEESVDWQTHRATLDVPFPNLPYLIDSSGPSPVQITQSNALLRYLARKFDFYGDSDNERVEIDVLQEEAYDYRNKIIASAYTLGADYEAAFAEFIEEAIPRHVDGFERYLSKRDAPSFFVGAKTSLVDFVLYELLWQTSLMVPGSITETNRPQLHRFIKAFEKQPRIATYRAGSDYIEGPINSPWASFT